MATPLWKDYYAPSSTGAGGADTVDGKMRQALATLASGTNPDGTAFSLPVTGVVSGGQTPGDGVANPTDASDTRAFLEIFNGTTWDRVRGSNGSINVTSGAPAAANILDGFLDLTATTAATAFLTIPAGRTWVGYITLNCSAQIAAASTSNPIASGVVATAGTGVTPTAGSYIRCDALNGANAAAGTVGTGIANSLTTRFVVIAPGGNSVTLTLASTNQGTSHVTAMAIGELQ